MTYSVLPPYLGHMHADEKENADSKILKQTTTNGKCSDSANNANVVYIIMYVLLSSVQRQSRLLLTNNHYMTMYP